MGNLYKAYNKSSMGKKHKGMVLLFKKYNNYDNIFI